MSSRRHLARLLAGASLIGTLAALAAPALAADAAAAAPAPTMTGAGSEGTDVEAVIVTAEQNRAAATAPTKASLDQTQPEAIISRGFIEQVTPETGSWVSAAAFAPSLSGISSNGGGVGETAKLNMRGFPDGDFNITYDGIAFGDTNGPTHHQASYWPASTIGAVVVDRGPGAAGDLGQANFGGAIHFFSADPSHTFGAVQKFTYGSFRTLAAVTTLNTGDLPGGGRLYLNFDERNSNGELSYSGGEAQNQLIKYVQPLSDKVTLTLFGSHNYTRFYQSDAGPGETYYQVQAYGKNFALNANPLDEHYYKYNQQSKQTDFEYADLKGEIAPTITAENQLYSYFYTNKTWSVNSISDAVLGDANPLVGVKGAGPAAPNSTSLINNATGTEQKTDIGGYDKLNQYRVSGDIVRVNKDWSFGTLKLGGVYEWSTTDRHNLFDDFTAGGPDHLGAYPDIKFTAKAYPNLPAPTNAKLQENSAYQTWQVFADFSWRPTSNLTLSPGFKYVHSTIEVDAADENVAGGLKNQALVAQNTYTQPLYFFTGNYKIRSDWSIYAQVATSFLLPGLPNLYYAAANIQSLQPERTTTYQGGTVYTHGNITADADVYRVDATNLQQACTISDPLPEAALCNVGSARYTGVEGEAAYALGFGLTVFANGSLGSAKQLANAANPGAGITANPAQTLANTPNSTLAAGGIYRHGPWVGSLTYKRSGTYVAGYSGTVGNRFPGYDTFDASAGYTWDRFTLKVQGFNLLDRRATTGYNGTLNLATATAAQKFTDTGLYTFQAGRELSLTLSAKF
jgi:iron complex outermembrane receptor protein